MKESLSNNISYFRNVKGLSQNELANLAKIPQSTISDIESGKRKNPGVNTIIAIAKVLNVKINDLLK
ncbi:Predicted transcriptional regulator [Megamonas hypermegale]|jgi:transcriptional regulator with XRE-family HTH domain|uniref:Predicted transcriptional regulator n=1 Tax=Megamonas hypermegale TaxID=158847 RepID=A0A378NUK5_9FIRM|nr:helix-turn-helix transcriptional regulator [Megamonas hypermegale]STY71515.1 Predicted transcriptional regulator [Megamonas hypermegale]